MLKLQMLILIILFSNAIPAHQQDYTQSMVFVTLKNDIFKFPHEIYGYFFTINDDTITIEIDSLHLSSDSSVYDEGEILSRIDLSKRDSRLNSNMIMDIDTEFVNVLKIIDAYYVARIFKSFNPADTILHEISSRGEIKYVRSPNFNLHLRIRYRYNIDAKKVAEKFRKINCVEWSGVNEKPIKF